MTPEEAKLAAGGWLRIGEVIRLLGVSRTTVHRLLSSDPPAIRYRVAPGPGQYRECHPDDVRRLLEERRRIHGDQ